MENPIDQRGGKKECLPRTVVFFFCEISLVNTALSRSTKLFNNSCFSQKFLDNHKANAFPNGVFILHIPLFSSKEIYS